MEFNPVSDGSVSHTYTSGEQASWATIIGSAGDGSSNNFNSLEAETHTQASIWEVIARVLLSFDTSSVGAGVILSATLKLTNEFFFSSNGWDPSVVVVEATPASPTTIVNSDYATLGTVPLSDVLARSAAPSPLFTLNAAGLAAVNKSGITVFGVRFEDDRAGTEPSWGSDPTSEGTAWAFRDGEYFISSQRPKLILEVQG